MIRPSTAVLLIATLALSAVSACRDLPLKAPLLADMTLARPPEKLSPPVDVRYLVTPFALTGDADVAVAVVPRVAGSNLRVSFAQSQGMQIASGGQEMAAQSVIATTVYRRSLAVKAAPAAAGTVQVLVSIDVGESSFFGVYLLPLTQPLPRKSDPAESAR